MLLIKIFILLTLSLIFWQDMISRTVYWWAFPSLAISLIGLRLMSSNTLADLCYSFGFNSGFLLLQFLLVSAYFSWKNGHRVNITKDLLGWGDILFLLAIGCYLSMLNFLLFYTISLIIILFFWLTSQLLVNNKTNGIPLAGLQALIFLVFVCLDWWYRPLNLTDDTWLLYLITK